MRGVKWVALLWIVTSLWKLTLSSLFGGLGSELSERLAHVKAISGNEFTHGMGEAQRNPSKAMPRHDGLREYAPPILYPAFRVFPFSEIA